MGDESTELKIRQAARDVFIQKGMTGARMQEIADKAGINKALLHYYYRNKELLFKAVFRDVLREMFPRFFAIFQEDIPLEVKLYQLADQYVNFLSRNPSVPVFMINELHRDAENLFEKLEISSILDLSIIQKQLDEEFKKGNIKKISVTQFMINVASLLVFPFMAAPLVKEIGKMDQRKFSEFLELRKKEVPRFIMDALRP